MLYRYRDIFSISHLHGDGVNTVGGQ